MRVRHKGQPSFFAICPISSYSTIMSEITKKELEHYAYLSRLALTDAESKKFLSDLDAVVHYVKELEMVDTKGVEPLIGAASAPNVLRADEVDADIRPAARPAASRIRDGFPASEKNYLKVPKIL